MKFSMDLVRAGAAKGMKILGDHMPEILIGCGVAGIVLTAVESARATPKATQELEALKAKKDEELKYPRPVEKGIILGKNYWRTALAGAVTAGCFIQSHNIDIKRQAAMSLAYSVAEKTLEEYQGKTVEIAGPKKAEEIDTAMVKDYAMTQNLSNVPGIGPLWIFGFSNAAFRADRQVVDAAINKMNSDLVRCTGLASFSGEISMDDIQDYFAEVANAPQLKAEKHPLGNQFGFSMDRTGQIDPNIKWAHDSAGNPCGILRFEPRPLVEARNIACEYYD